MNGFSDTPQAFPAAQLDAAGLNRQVVFDLAALPAELLTSLGDTSAFRQLILIGHGGRLLWQCVKTSGIASPDPIDDYTRRTLAQCFAAALPNNHYRLLYPGNAPLRLQQLGELAGWHQPSPFMVGVDAEWGSWSAYRAVVLADTRFTPTPRHLSRSPCPDCTTRPCQSACPAGAVSAGGFDLGRCVAWRKLPASSCEFTCLARTACPAGSEHRYSDEQLHHCYGISMQTIRQYY